MAKKITGWLDKYNGPTKCPEGYINIDGNCIKKDSDEYRNLLDQGKVGTMKDDVWYGNKAELEPITIYSNTDKDTQQFYDKLKQYSEDIEDDGKIYETLLDLGQKYGHPKVSMKNTPGFFDPKYSKGSSRENKVRPHYNPFTQRMTISDDPENFIDQYTAELAHQKQVMKKGPTDFILKNIGQVPDIITKGYQNLYKTPGTTEYEAHAEIEPNLINELGDKYSKSYFIKDYYNSPGTFSNENPNIKYKNGGPVQENYNNNTTSYPPGFVGMGNNTQGRNYSPSWGGSFQMGGSIPGATGFSYGRIGDIPSNGKYAKKTLASAQNGKEMSYYQNGLDWKPRNISRDGSVIKDDMGYWNPNNHGKVVEISSPDITMEGVHQPLLGISDTGDTKLMKPGKNYKFKGKKVTEFPIAQNGNMTAIGDAINYTKEYMNSPMYKQMLNASTQDAETFNLNRNNNLMSASFAFPEWQRKKVYGDANMNTGKVNIYPSAIKDNYLDKVLVHELSHVTDMSGIPEKDINLMKKYQQESNKSNKAFKNDNIFKALGLNNKKLKNLQQDNLDYIGQPTETRSRLNQIRYMSKNDNLYDPFNEKVTPKILKKLKNNPHFQELQTIYSDDQILDLLNTVSKNNDNNSKFQNMSIGKNGVNQQDQKTYQQLDQLLNFTNYNKPTSGGWLDKYF